jgi:hypothetical protein
MFPKMNYNLKPGTVSMRLLIALLAIVLVGGRARSADCWIHGTIEDGSGAVIPSSRPVILESDTNTLKLPVNEYGSFNGEVPCGRYTITTTVPYFKPLGELQSY